MPDYRRYFVPGGTYFFSIVTYHRQPLFANKQNVQRLRNAVAFAKKEMPFEICAAAILPDHMHFLWSLPSGDDAYSKRIGRMKVEFTRALRGVAALPSGLPFLDSSITRATCGNVASESTLSTMKRISTAISTTFITTR